MTETPKIQRIVRHGASFCPTHKKYRVFRRDAAGEVVRPLELQCPVCRQESERDEGLDFFGGKATNGA